MHRFFLLFLLVIALGGCKSIAPQPSTLQPQLVPSPPISFSTLSLPIEIDLKPYFIAADKQVDTRFTGSESPCEGVAFNYYFERDPLKFTGTGTEVTTDVNGRYKIHMSYCPKCSDLFSTEPACLSPRIQFSCGINEPLRRIHLSFISDVTVNPDYSLSTKTRLGELDAVDPCRVTVFRFDATGELLKEIKKSLGKLATDIDKQTQKINFHSDALNLWNMMQKPLAVSNFGFLSLHPEKILLSRPKISGTTMRTTLQVIARPAFASRPDESGPKELPPLVVSERPLNDTLVVFSDLSLDYDSLSAQLTEQLRDRTFNLKGKEIRIDDIRINGAVNSYLLFKVRFSGDKKGIIYLTGQPVLDTENDKVWLTNADFDLDTKHLLLKSAKWLFNDRILEEISKACTQDLRPYMTALANSVNNSLNYRFQNYALTGKVLEIKIENLYAAEKELIVRARSRAKLKLTDVTN